MNNFRNLKQIESSSHPDKEKILQDIETFRQNGYAMIDTMIEYHKSILHESIPVKPNVQPGYLRPLLGDYPPISPVSYIDVMSQVQQHIFKGVLHWQHPKFLGYFPSLTSFPSKLADMLASCWNTIGFTWESCPAATELEILMLDWLIYVLHLPNCFLSQGAGGGIIQTTATECIHTAILAARERTWDFLYPSRETATVHDASKLVVYFSEETNKAAFKVAKCAGLTTHVIQTCEIENYSVNFRALCQAIENDIFNGLVPCIICLTIGSTNTGSIDPIQSLVSGILKKAYNFPIWFHVDAAYAGSFAALEECQPYFTGLNLLDSYNFNPHKMLKVGMDCAILYTKSISSIRKAMSATKISADYLKSEY